MSTEIIQGEVTRVPVRKIGGTKVRLRIPETHPVAQGVLREIGEIGEIPSCVRQVTVSPDTVVIERRGREGRPERFLSLGECLRTPGTDTSEITIFAGSIEVRQDTDWKSR